MPNSKGYVLIEHLMTGLAQLGLLAVVGIIGIQLAISVQRLSASREQAHFATMRWDLENLAARQAIYHADENSYSSAFEELHFATSEGVTVAVEALPSGWSGIATHGALGTGEGCTIYVGAVPVPVGPVTPSRPGELACTD